MVLVPGSDGPGHAIPFEDILVGIPDHAGLERDQRIRYLESRSRQLGLARPNRVAGNDEIILDLVADERAFRAVIDKALGERFADFAPLRRDVGECADRQDSSGSNEAERVAAMNHDGYPFSWK